MDWLAGVEPECALCVAVVSYRERSSTREVGAWRSGCCEEANGNWAPVWAASCRMSSVDGYEGEDTDEAEARSSLTLEGTVPRLWERPNVDEDRF